MKRNLRSLSALMLGLVAGACGESTTSSAPETGTERCVPNATLACLCPDGRSGVQTCAADGARYGDCACLAPGDAGAGGASGGGGGSGGGATGGSAGGASGGGGGPSGGEIVDASVSPPDVPAAPLDPAVCTEHTPDAKNCKDCCDCAAPNSCDDATACREACDALPPEHWTPLADVAPFVPEPQMGPDGDYGACLRSTGSEQECKVCCCGLDLVCGDAKFCRDACDAYDFTQNPPAEAAVLSHGAVASIGGGGGACTPTEDRYLDAEYGQVVVGGQTFTVPSPVTDMPRCTDLYNPCNGGENPDALSSLQTLVLDDGPDARTITGTLYADNDFELWVNGQPVCRDAVDYVPFNAHVVRFRASGPLTIAVNLVDAEEALGVGVERGTFVGDGGFAARFEDETGATVAATGADWRCQPQYIAPLDDAGCLRGRDSSACPAPSCPADGDYADCTAALFPEPAGWTAPGFDAAAWPAATVFPLERVAPKPAYVNHADRFAGAEFIWSANLDLDNRVLCRWSEAGGGAPIGLDAVARCAAIQDSVRAAGFAADVAVDCDGTYAWLRSDVFPDHDLMNGITGTNEQIPVPAAFAAPVKLSPTLAAAPVSIDGALGVAVNGVPIFDYSSQGELDLEHYDPATDVVVQGQLDLCNGHAGRGDDYHYHAAPTCMMDAMENAGDDAILGWGYDGFPLYGFRRPDGGALAAGDLDLCNGMADPVFGFRYHATVAPPYVFQCLRGEVDAANLPRVTPPVNPETRMRRETGRPPQGGVEGLHFERDGAGGASMTYQYRGHAYHITYTATDRPGCYQFDTETVTSGVVRMEYCRE